MSGNEVCFRRLQKELVAIQKNPVEHISTTPNESNLLEWHYVIEGPSGSVYEGGFYHGVLRFPKEYPYKPPSILMFTRNGRFKQNVRLCLSMSDYHPESWNPMWSVSSILSGLMSFMLDSQSTLGSLEATDEQRRQYARLSLEENLKNATFRKLFPHYVTLGEERARQQVQMRENEPSNAASSDAPTEVDDQREEQHIEENNADDRGRPVDNTFRRRMAWGRVFMAIGAAAVALIAMIWTTILSKATDDPTLAGRQG